MANAPPGSPVTLTATVISSIAPNPTGSVTILDNGTLISSQPLTDGVAILNISSLAQGSHSFTAQFAGSTNFASSVSTPQLITAGPTGPTPDFTLASTGTTSQTILSGSSANFTFTVAFQGNLSSPITLAATGLPNLATASFNPAVIPPGTTNPTFTLTIATPNTVANSPSANRKPMLWALLLSPLALLATRSRKATKLLIVILLSATLMLADGCGDRVNAAGAQSRAAKSYTITVTGTATTATGTILQHTATVTLLLEQPQ